MNEMQLDGFRVARDSMHDSLVQGNILKKNGEDGIKINDRCTIGFLGACVFNNAGGANRSVLRNSGNKFKGNIASGNLVHDCHDDTRSTDPGFTAGTRNLWESNIGKRVNVAGICFPGNQVVTPYEHDPFA